MSVSVNNLSKEYGSLTAFDPQWSPSYGQLAEAYLVFSKTSLTVDLYEKAAPTGAPYYAHHLNCAAKYAEFIGYPEHALKHYKALHTIIPNYSDILTIIITLSKHLGYTNSPNPIDINPPDQNVSK